MSISQTFFDPRWLRIGEFDLSTDPRGSTRTVRVRRALEEGERRPFKLKPLPARGRACEYYLREGEQGAVEAQYYMSIDRTLRTLALGLSIEKGEEYPGASSERQMDRTLWDWPNLVNMPAHVVHEHLSAISTELGRPIGFIVDTHRQDDGREQERETVPFVFTGDAFLKRSAPVSVNALVAQLDEIDHRTRWWADVWVVAEFTESEVAVLSPENVAERLLAFRSLRKVLRRRARDHGISRRATK